MERERMTKTVPGGTAVYPDLAGKTAVVTGGSRGIGAEVAKALAANGVAVAVAGRDHEALGSVVNSIAAGGGRAVAVAADCTVEDDLHRLESEVHRQLGPVDILIAFAGGYGQPVATSEETAGHWRQVLDGDLTATFLAISTFLPDLTSRTGAIVTMSSSAARQATGASAAYAAAKAGVIGLSRHLAGELAGAGVRVNCLAPATVENDRMRKYMNDETRARLAAGFPLGRMGQPADIAAATVFLASAASSWITGITVDVAGGKYTS
jgi:3-oxoacyl-[acyl-carrier protein] reductase